jgi:hypothetical protein
MLPVTAEPRPLLRGAFRAVVGIVLSVGLLALGGSATASTHSLATAAAPPSVFGIGPSNGTLVDGRPYFYFLAKPGTTISDHVAVVNVGTQPLALSVYAADAGNASDGTFNFPAAAAKPVEVGAWVRVDTPHGTRQIVVPGRSTVHFPITVHVPLNAAIGDHAGGVVVSLLGVARNSQGQLIHLDQRVAARIFVRVQGPLHPQLTVENLHVTYHGTANPVGKGTVEVTYTVRNTGNVKLGARQRIDVTGLLGTHARAVNPPDVPLLLPDGSAQEKITVTGVLPTGRETATVTLTGLALPADANPAAGPWTASTHFWAFPWTLLLLLLLIAAGILGWRWRQRRRARGGSGAAGDGPGGSAGPDGDGPDGPGPTELLDDDQPVAAPKVGSRP